MVYVYVCVYLHPHVAAVFLQLLPHVLSSQSCSIQHQMLPLDWLEDVGVVRHIQADLHLREAGNEIKRILVDSNSFFLPPYHMPTLLFSPLPSLLTFFSVCWYLL